MDRRALPAIVAAILVIDEGHTAGTQLATSMRVTHRCSIRGVRGVKQGGKIHRHMPCRVKIAGHLLSLALTGGAGIGKTRDVAHGYAEHC